MNIINSSFKHGANFKIGYFNVIEEDVIVGDNVKIENYVLLKKGTRIGDNVYVDSYVRSSGDNKIGNNVILRFGSTIARQVFVGDKVFISPNVMTVYSLPDGGRGEGTIIETEAYIGTAAILDPNIRIGKQVIIGANSFVNRSCIEKGIYVGSPAKLVKKI